jgi:hypothetical protein
LSAQPFILQPGSVGEGAAGAPVPAINVSEPTGSASLVPTIECGPGTFEPLPNDQTTWCG